MVSGVWRGMRARLHTVRASRPCIRLRGTMPPRATAAEKGKGKAGARKRAAADDDELPLSLLLARCTRADLEALLLEHEGELRDLRTAVEAKLRPEQARPSLGVLARPRVLVFDVSCRPRRCRSAARVAAALIFAEAAQLRPGAHTRVTRLRRR